MRFKEVAKVDTFIFVLINRLNEVYQKGFETEEGVIVVRRVVANSILPINQNNEYLSLLT